MISKQNKRRLAKAIAAKIVFKDTYPNMSAAGVRAFQDALAVAFENTKDDFDLGLLKSLAESAAELGRE